MTKEKTIKEIRRLLGNNEVLANELKEYLNEIKTVSLVIDIEEQRREYRH